VWGAVGDFEQVRVGFKAGQTVADIGHTLPLIILPLPKQRNQHPDQPITQPMQQVAVSPDQAPQTAEPDQLIQDEKAFPCLIQIKPPPHPRTSNNQEHQQNHRPDTLQ
jgi:hypothetical protein